MNLIINWMAVTRDNMKLGLVWPILLLHLNLGLFVISLNFIKLKKNIIPMIKNPKLDKTYLVDLLFSNTKKSIESNNLMFLILSLLLTTTLCRSRWSIASSVIFLHFPLSWQSYRFTSGSLIIKSIHLIRGLSLPFFSWHLPIPHP